MRISGLKTLQVFPENPQKQDFIINVTLNSAIETLKSFDGVSLLPSGSWMGGLYNPSTGKGYVPKLSDHDITVLTPNMPYHSMEATVYDVKNCMNETVQNKLEFHKIRKGNDYGRILSLINIFPPPQIQECFNSYQQFRDCTNLKLSLHKRIDTDKGLWQMSGLLLSHFENEGNLLYLNKDGALRFYPIKQNKSGFSRYIKQKGIYIPEGGVLYASDKLKIINEFIETMQRNTKMHTKTFFKYLQRINKFFFIDAKDDLFLIADDERKNTQPRFQKRVKVEREYREQYNKILRMFNELKISTQAFLPEEFIKITLKNLKTFSELSLEVLKWPTLRGFKGV